MMRARILWVTGITAGFVLLGCERRAEDETGEMTEETGITGEIEPQPLETELRPVNDSGITGNATVTRRDGQLVVDLTLDGANEGERYVAHVHKGQCGDDLGVAAAIGELTVTAGRNRITGSVDAASLEPAQTHFVQAHRGTDDEPVACGDLPALGLEDVPAAAAPPHGAPVQSPMEEPPTGGTPPAQGDTY